MSIQQRRVFVSYSRKNKDFVEKLVARLHNRCVVWWDQRLTPAERWWTSILEEIERCECFVLILTEPYTASVFCLTELDYAQQLGKPILPVVLDRAVVFPPGVASSQAAFIDGFSVGEAFGEIVAGVSGLRPDQYAAPDGPVPRPAEPTPTGQQQLSDLYADAAEAEADGNTSLAERFYQRLVAVDSGEYGKLAARKLEALRKARGCRADYENIVKLAARPATLPDAVDLWRVYVAQCGTAHDPHGFATDPRFVSSESSPAYEPGMDELLAAFREVIAEKSSLELLPQPFAWITIPAGKVMLITEKGREKNYIPEGKSQTFDLPAFEIAKYPVTNAQYKLFVDANGYSQRQWWTEAGWEAREQKKWTEPRYWDDNKWNQSDHPVVGVSWYESVAFCLWLSDVTGESIMLPTEQQWQRAAQGDTNWASPWGDEFDRARCNFNTTGTTAVTRYEGKGDSPFGVVDMSGNVWEWCLTAYVSGSTDLAGTDVRVLRGGSWSGNSEANLRAVSRDRGNPGYRYDNRGFRVVRSLF